MFTTIERANVRLQLATKFAEKFAHLMPENFGTLYPDVSMFAIVTSIPSTKDENMRLAGDVFGTDGWTDDGRHWTKEVDGIKVKLLGAGGNDEIPARPVKASSFPQLANVA